VSSSSSISSPRGSYESCAEYIGARQDFDLHNGIAEVRTYTGRNYTFTTFTPAEEKKKEKTTPGKENETTQPKVNPDDDYEIDSHLDPLPKPSE
jgi:hypothetical protein